MKTIKCCLNCEHSGEHPFWRVSADVDVKKYYTDYYCFYHMIGCNYDNRCDNYQKIKKRD